MTDNTSVTDRSDLQPPVWDVSKIPYFGDLSPKPTWEVVIKVSFDHR